MAYRSTFSAGVLLSTLVLAGLGGCEAGQDPVSTSAGPGGGAGGSGDGGASTTSTTTGGDGGGTTGVTVGPGSTGSGGEAPIAEVFGHSGTTLYRLDPDTNDVTVVGPFNGCDEDVIDIAIDKDSNLYGTTTNRPDPQAPEVPTGGLWRIDKNTAACTLVARGDFPNSLSFVPVGTLDPDEEALVGYVGRNYVRIDTLGGDITTVATNALPTGLESSGDIVSVIDGPTYLTVKGTGCQDTDCVIAVNPANGAAEGNLGSAGFDRVFGVAFWAGSLYGFTAAGDLFEFVVEENGEITTTLIEVSDGLEFYGAGSTTAAPPTDVPN